MVVRQRGQLSVASDDSACPNAGTNLSASASDTPREHSGHRSSPRPSSAWVACRSAKPTLFFRPTWHLFPTTEPTGRLELPTGGLRNAYSSCVADVILARSVTSDAAPSRGVTSSLLHELLHTPAHACSSGQREVRVTPLKPNDSRRQPRWIRRLAARPTAACSRAANRATRDLRQR